MRKLPLGRNGIAVSELGLGCVSMSSFYGAADEAASRATMRAALDQGIDFFDTADMYGSGHNESLIGSFMREAGRGRVIVATKFGSLPAGADGKPGVDNSPAHIAKACEASLRRLQVEAIDVYYMHRRDPAMPIADSVGAMARLVEAGKVRALGLSEVSAATLRQAHAVHPIAALQSEYSLWYREPEDDVLPVCRELGIAFVPFSPLGRGFLTGTLDPADLPAGDWRRKNVPRFQGDAAERNLALVRRLGEFSAKRGATPAQVALGWLLSKNDGSTMVIPIPGTKRPERVAENAAAAGLALSVQEVAELESIFSRDAVAGDRYYAVEASRAGT